jgi:hypothetical protein
MTDTDDKVMDRFKDLLDYPGRKKPVNRTPEKEAVIAERAEWDANPVYYRIDGEKQEFFLISHLAKALGYSQQAIRLWEGRKLMPNTPYRSPRSYKVKQKEQAGSFAPSNKGRRLWTRTQIEGILALARKHRVLLNKQAPTPAFARDVAILYREILAGDSNSK